MPRLFALPLLFLPALAFGQTTLQLDDNSMENLWSLTAPTAGPGDWIGAAYDPPLEFPFRVVSGTMYFLDTFCCAGNTCLDTFCTTGADWDRRLIAPANLAVDPAGLTPDLTAPIALQTGVAFAGAGASATSPPWTLTPEVWTLPGNTVFDHPGRIFYAIKYFSGDEWMRFAVDDNGPTAVNGYGIHTSDNFTTRSSIWTFGNVGMRVRIEPVFFLKRATSNPVDRYELAGSTNQTMLSIRVRGGNAATTITRVRATASGTGNDATGVAQVRLINDVDRDGVYDSGETVLASGTYGANDGAVDLNLNRTLAVGTTEEWLIVYDFSTTPAGGDSFRVRLNAASDVTSNLGAPFVSGTGGTGGVQGPLLTIAGRLSVSRAPASAPAQVVPAGSSALPVLSLRLNAENEAFTVNNVAFRADGSLHDVLELAQARLYLDADQNGLVTAGDTLLSSGVYLVDDGLITFSTPGLSVPRNLTRDLMVVYDLAPAASGGDGFRAIFAAPADLVASGPFSGPVPTTGPRALVGAPVIGNLLTVGGALSVAAGAANPGNRTAQPGAINIPVLQLTLSAAAEAIELQTLTFRGSGSGDEVLDLDRARLFRDVNANGLLDGGDLQVGSSASFANNDGTVTFALSGESVPTSGSRAFLLVYDFTAAPTGGETFRASLENAAALSATGQISGAPITATGAFPIQGGVVTLLGGLSVTPGPNHPAAGNVQPGRADYPVAQLQLAAQGEQFTITSLRLTPTGSLHDQASIGLVEVVRDLGLPGVRDPADVLLASGTYAGDDTPLVLTTSANLAAGTTERWLITYDLGLSANAGQTFRVAIGAADLVASGNLSGPASVAGLPLQGNLQTVGGSLRVAAGPANPAGGTILPNSTDVAMLQVVVEAVFEPITVTGLSLRASGSGNEVADLTRARLFVDTNNNGQLDPVGDLPLGAPATYAQNDGLLVFSFAGRTLAAGTGERWLVLYDLAGAAPAGSTFQLQLQNNTDVAANAPSGPLPQASGAPVVGGVRTVLGRLSVARTANSPPARTVRRDGVDLPILGLNLSGNGEAFSVSQLRFTAAGSLDDVSELDHLSLVLDADASGTLSAADSALGTPGTFSGDDGTVTFSGLGLNVPPTGNVTLLVLARLNGTASGGNTFRINLSTASDLTATGLGGRVINDAVGLPVGSHPITIGGVLEVGLGAASPIARVVPRSSAPTSALQLRLVANYEPVTLTRLTLHASGSGQDATGLAQVELSLDGNADGLASPGEPVLGVGTFPGDDGALTFTLNQPIQVGPALFLLARVRTSNAPIGGQTFRLGLDPATDVGSSSGSGAVVTVGAPVLGAILTAGGGFVVELGSNNPAGNLVNQALQNVPVAQLSMLSDNEACTVQSLTLRAIGSIHDRLDLTAVRLLRDVNGNGQVDFADVAIGAPATYSADDGLVAFTGLGRNLGLDAREDWLVVYDLSGQASNLETFGLRLESNADLVVSCNVSGPVTPSGAPLESNIHTVQQDGALVISRGSETPPSLFLAAGTVRAAVLQLRLAASVQPLTLDNLTLTASTSAGAAADVLETVDLYRDVNQDGILDRSDVLISGNVVPDANGRITFLGLAATLPVDEARYYLAAVNVAAGAVPGTRFTVRLAANGDAPARTAFGPAVVTGAPFASAEMTVAGALNLQATAVPDQTVANDAAGLIALRFSALALWERFRLRSLTLSAEGTLDPAYGVRGVTVVLDQDGDGLPGANEVKVFENLRFPEGSRRLPAAGLDVSLDPGTPMAFLVVLDLDGTARVDETLRLSIASDVDVLAQGDRLGLTSPVGAPIVGGRLTVGASLELAIGPNPPPAQIVAANALAIPVLQLVAQAANEDVTLSRLTLTPSGTLDDGEAIARVELRLDVDGDGQVDAEDVPVAPGLKPSSNDGALSFGPIAERVPRNGAATYLVTIDLSGGGTAGQTFQLRLASDADVTAFGAVSGAVAARGAPLVGAELSLIGALNVRLGTSSPPGSGVSPGARFPALGLELFSRGESVNVQELSLRIRGSADDGAIFTNTRLYLDDDADGVVSAADVLLAEALPDGNDGLIRFPSLGLGLEPDDAVTLLVELELSSEAAVGGDLRLGLENNTSLRATGAQSGDLTAVGAPILGSAFTIVRAAADDGGGAGTEDGCGCRAVPDQGRPAPIGWMLLLGLAWRRRRSRVQVDLQN
ncbi:MAG: hypothetical protein IPG45_05695 [Deltaproteobacteria bacterium]|nr:hypothetical protein [Deltaproteobacteria bacterium]